MKHLYRTIAAFAAAVLASVSSATAVAQAPALLRVLGASPEVKPDAKLGDGTTVKARIARPDVAALDEIARHHVATQHKSRFVIDLFPGLELEAEVVAAEIRRSGTTLFARLTDIDLGNAVFTIEGGIVTATVDFPGGSYLVTPQPGGDHQVAQKAAQLFAPELDPRPVFQPKRVASPFGPDLTTSAADGESGRLIDVMILWTPAAQTANGGLAAMQNLAQAAIDSANAAYLNSGVAQRLRLVHRQQVTYTERTSCGGSAFDCALDDVTYNGDGYIDNVHALRDTHGADLVALLIHDGTFCGLAWLPSYPTSDAGFSVTAHNCTVGNKSFVHELGHNMGAHHDPANATPDGPKPFNQGYISPQLDWRTVMSYPGPCGGCTRINYFSNPKLTNNGIAMGTAAVSNNAHVLNFTGKAIAGYRATSALHPVPQRFADIATSHPFFGDIEFFAQAGITIGCSMAEFCPDSVVTRDQMAVFLERVLRASNWTPSPPSGGFNDVPPGNPFAGHIEQLYVDGITGGCSSSPLLYCPDGPVTRGQMAVFLLNASCGPSYTPPPPPSQTFADVPLDHPFARHIHKLYGLGVTHGCATSPLRYCPDAVVTRGQAAALIERSFPFRTPSEACSP